MWIPGQAEGHCSLLYTMSVQDHQLVLAAAAQVIFNLGKKTRKHSDLPSQWT